jgi:hypothetical protein
MNIEQTTTITGIPYFNSIRVTPHALEPIELEAGEAECMIPALSIERVRDLRDALTAAIEAAESNIMPPVRLFTPGQTLTGNEDLPIGTYVLDDAKDIWIVGPRGLGMERGAGPKGEYPLRQIVNDYGPVTIASLPGDES